MIELLKLVFSLVRSIFRRDAELILENLALRHQLQIALRSHPRPRLSGQDHKFDHVSQAAFERTWSRRSRLARS
jgi:hypothetical protein